MVKIPYHAGQQMLEAWLQGNTVKVALGDNTTSYTFDAAAHEFVSDVFDGGTTAQELTVTNYSRKTLDTAAGDFTQDDTDGEGVWDSTNVSWSNLGGDSGKTTAENTIQFLLVYLQVGGDDTTPGDDPIVFVQDDDSAGSLVDLPRQTTGVTESLEWASEGLVNATSV